MGNEMGNRNVSGPQEQDNTEVEDSNKSSEAPMPLIDADDLKGGNQLVSLAEGGDYHEKHSGLASEDSSRKGDPNIEKQTSDGTDEIEDKPPNESSKSPVASSEENGEENETQLASSFEDGKYHENYTGLASEEILSGTNDHQIQKCKSIRREEEETRASSLDTKSASHEPKSLKTIDSEPYQRDSPKILADSSVGDCNGLQRSSLDILGLNVAHAFEDTGHTLETEITHSPSRSVISNSNSEVTKNGDDVPTKEMVSQEEKALDMSTREEIFGLIDGVEVGNGSCKTTTMNLLNGFVNKGDGEQKLTELNLVMNDSLDLQHETIPLTKSLDSFHLEASESEVKCVVLTDYTELIGNGSEIEQNKYDPNPTSLSVESVVESKKDTMNISQFEFTTIGTDHEEKSCGNEFDTSCNSEIEKEFRIDEADVTQNGYQVGMHDNSLGLISEEHCKDSEKETEIVAEIDTGLTELTVTDSNHEVEEISICSLSLSDPTEKEVVKEMMEKTEDSFSIGEDMEGREKMNKCLSQLHPIQPEEIYPVSPVQSQDSKQDTVMESEIIENRCESIMESSQASFHGLVVTKTSNLDSPNSTVETLVSSLELEDDNGKDPSRYLELTATANEPSDISIDCSHEQEPTCDSDSGFGTTEKNENSSSVLDQGNYTAKADVNKQSSFDFENQIAETEIPAIQSHEQYSDQSPAQHRTESAKGEVSAFASCDSEAQESVETIMESNPENLNIHVEVSKPASFDFDFQVEARTEESDQTPMLYQEKTANKTVANEAEVVVGVGNPVAETEFSAHKEVSCQDPLQYEEMPVERKVATLERTDSEKLRNPLIASKKTVEHEWNLTANKLMATSPKGSEKRRPKSSLFSNCLCCAAVIH
ncbi:hypothetical protein HHK36_012706 [Tetracentron sinense]|uniref:Uncharacterized protein n=1 Tax=Tetracentron sinense TaxID=13715 RepID=A0A834Z978_TETSI|nr:hypothetical protein HHK36_012706 [Tetracentron sinense]